MQTKFDINEEVYIPTKITKMYADKDSASPSYRVIVKDEDGLCYGFWMKENQLVKINKED